MKRAINLPNLVVKYIFKLKPDIYREGSDRTEQIN